MKLEIILKLFNCYGIMKKKWNPKKNKDLSDFSYSDFSSSSDSSESFKILENKYILENNKYLSKSSDFSSFRFFGR
eukprot:jgi/Orpsp1_1/1183022/evm.model.c7180000083538.1